MASPLLPTVLVLLLVGCGGASASGSDPTPAVAAEPETPPESAAPRTHTMTFAGPSMEPLLSDGDTFTLVEASDFSRGDVIVFLDPEDHVVGKRIVAVGGDTLAIIDGALRLDREPVPTTELGLASDDEYGCFEEALPGETAPHVIVRSTLVPPFDVEPIEIPAGHVYVLGDSRDRSNDSRNPRIGPIPLARIAGRITDPTPHDGPRLTCRPRSE